MTDNVVVKTDKAALFAEHFGIPKRSPADGVRFNEAKPEDQRAIAVACALELINTRVGTGGVALLPELRSLSMYADFIQAALKSK